MTHTNSHDLVRQAAVSSLVDPHSQLPRTEAASQGQKNEAGMYEYKRLRSFPALFVLQLRFVLQLWGFDGFQNIFQPSNGKRQKEDGGARNATHY